MDIKEFAQEFLDNINVAVEMGNTDYTGMKTKCTKSL